jgi:hypothetical protein
VNANEQARARAAGQEAKVKILLDYPGLLRLVYGWETGDYCRHFVADAPARVIVAFLNGLDEELLAGAVVEAQSGGEIGLAGRVRPGDEGREYSKVTIFERVNGPPEMTLTQLLDGSPKDEL